MMQLSMHTRLCPRQGIILGCWCTDLLVCVIQCCVSLLCDFALVYLLAPTVRAAAASKSGLSTKMSSLPAHVFQSPPPGHPG
jgi:hypothetical protein